MNLFLKITLAILVFLALSSGVTKILLLEQDVAFFAKYGFSRTAIVIEGASQVIGGVMLVFQRTRFVGAAIVAITFLMSAILLYMDGNIPVMIVTIIALVVLGLHMRHSLTKSQGAS